jgi:hypothetical protein
LKKIISILSIGLLIFSGIGVVSVADDNTFYLKTEKKQLVFSEPIIKDEGDYVTVNLEKSTTSLLDAEKPQLPVVTQVFTFPFKTKINQVEVIFSEPKNMVLSKEVKPAPYPIMLDTELQTTNQIEKNIEIYASAELYPSTTFSYTIGAGLANDEHVIYLAIKCYPVRYSPTKNIIYYSDNAEIIISYEEPTNPVSFSEEYNLVIISPSEFSNTLQPLINHKNSYGVNTFLKTTETIYSEYSGYDEIEKIKYFIKDAIETYGAQHVLLIGGIEKLPIRTTWFFERYHDHYWNESILSDLYYADIYDENSNFCSWDSNGNHLFGENFENVPGVNDSVDLYADVNIGRIPCDTKNELRIVINKIIYYEKNTRSAGWFNNIILIGGDTFPGWSIYEGEKKNTVTQQIMSDFNSTKLWTSDDTFSARAFNKALNDGAGFVDYSGHGYEIGISTHPPNSNRWIGYYFFNLFFASNGNKLPIIFFDACLTAKLDFKLSEFISYILPFNLNQNTDQKTTISSVFEKQLPCFGWSFVKKKNNGAIATIGATRTAFTNVDGSGVHGGAGYLSVRFFAAYESCETVAQMLTKAQNDYINYAFKDYFTIEEFIIIGDPSLKVGGY